MRLTSRALVGLFLATALLVPPSFSAPASLVEAKRIEAKVLDLIRDRRFTEALPLAKRALKIRETALGAEHPSLILFLNRLAFIHSTLKNSKEAASLRVRALKVQKRVAEKRKRASPKGEGKRLYAEAGRLRRSGNFTDAGPICQRALAIFYKLGKPRGLARTWKSTPEKPGGGRKGGARRAALDHIHRAELFEAKSRYEEAEAHYRRSLAILENSAMSGELNNTTTATVLKNLGNLHIYHGQYREAESFL